jgi:hypothetical protein
VEYPTSSYPSQTRSKSQYFVFTYHGQINGPFHFVSIRILLLIGLPSSDGDPPSPPPGAQRKLLPCIIDERPQTLTGHFPFFPCSTPITEHLLDISISIRVGTKGGGWGNSYPGQETRPEPEFEYPHTRFKTRFCGS